MNDKQRAMLLDVISEWAGIINDSAAAARMTQLKVDIHETWFAWSGPTTGTMGNNITAYYRIRARTWSSNTLLRPSAATLPFTFIPCIAIQPTTTGGG